MIKDMWFGTQEYMQWVKAPDVSPDATGVGWAAQTQYLGGGASVRRSLINHKEYTLSWKMKNRLDVIKIKDYAEGVYGDGTIYWLDPFTMDMNVLPQMWATPWLGVESGIPLTGNYAPDVTTTPANDWGYPTRTAQYLVSPDDNKLTLYLPIPPEHTLWIGAKGTDGTGGKVMVLPDTGLEQALTLLPVTAATRFNASFTGISGVSIYLGGTGSINLSAMQAQVLPNGVTPELGRFISGQGHSGCSFADAPVTSPFNVAIDRIGLTVKLVETDAWA
jgi:hypothetical protein